MSSQVAKAIAHVNIRILVLEDGNTMVEIINHLGGPVETCNFNAQRDFIANAKLQKALINLKGMEFKTSERL